MIQAELTEVRTRRKIDAMWRLTMFFLCLVAALSGTPLRQAEAAADYARTVGECERGEVLHDVDGGVGDDKEASILPASGNTQLLPAAMLLAAADASFTSLDSASSLQKIGCHGRVKLLSSRTASSAQRRAWLQCFLI